MAMSKKRTMIVAAKSYDVRVMVFRKKRILHPAAPDRVAMMFPADYRQIIIIAETLPFLDMMKLAVVDVILAASVVCLPTRRLMNRDGLLVFVLMTGN
jgi:hypothetical protein